MVEQRVNKFRWKRKAERRQRRLHQVFLRGDNIVTVKPVLQDVLKNWSQLVPQWTAAGIPESAFLNTPRLNKAGHSSAVLLPPATSTSAVVTHLQPGWAKDKQ